MALPNNLGRLAAGLTADASLNIGVGVTPSGTFRFEVGTTSKFTGVATFGSTLSNGTYTYTLPSATGTLALTSDLNGYLPLTGGTLTGALGGTSATFSGTLTAVNISNNGIYYGRANASFPTTSLGYFALKTNNLDAERGGLTVQVSNSTSTFIDALTINYTGAATFSNSITTAGNINLQDSYVLNLGYNQAGGATLKYNANGNLDITPRGGYSTIFTAGNVGIGTASPQILLHIVKSSNPRFDISTTDSYSTAKTLYLTQTGTTGIVEAYNYLGGVGLPLALNPSGGNVLIGTTTDNGDKLQVTGNTTMSANLGVGRGSESGVRLSIQAAGTSGSAYSIITRDSLGNDLFIIRNDGYTAFGTNGRANSPYNYNVTFNPRTAGLGQGGDFGYITSTRESKGNIETIKNIDFINMLNPVSFNYRKKDTNNKEFINELYNDIYYGFIADEVEKVDKNLVFYDDLEDGSKKLSGVHYNSIIAILTKAIQEQQEQIKELQSQINK
jgi:hypothetical protein